MSFTSVQDARSSTGTKSISKRPSSELKVQGAVPLWLAHILGELDVFPTGFSKYGVCYKNNILDKYINGVITCV